ncbi:MAG TPA: amidase, partial [Kofleriaceae bacterium]|nr:amidase [Kofleriaceae bacterium]
VRRLRAAGADIVGHTNMDELGIGVRSHSQLHGETANPWHHQHSPGGSSGGSAAAVAAGLCVAALGVDTAGSIRIPAALCGVTGVLPDPDLVPGAGDTACPTRFDRIGPLARSAADCARVLDAITGRIGEHGFTGELARLPAGLRVGIAVRYAAGASPPVLASFLRSVRAVGRLGVTLGRSQLERVDARPMLDLLACDRARALAPILANRPEAAALLEPGTRAQLEAGHRLTAADRAAAAERCDQIAAALIGQIDPFDVVMLPTTTIAAPRRSANSAHRLLLLNTFAFNLSGQPAITIPNGFAGGLPTGVMFVGRPGSTRTLLQLAHAVQETTHHHRIAPMQSDGDTP